MEKLLFFLLLGATCAESTFFLPSPCSKSYKAGTPSWEAPWSSTALSGWLSWCVAGFTVRTYIFYRNSPIFLSASLLIKVMLWFHLLILLSYFSIGAKLGLDPKILTRWSFLKTFSGKSFSNHYKVNHFKEL